jgi:hypothetical protein
VTAKSLGEFDIGYFRLLKSLKISIPIPADPPVLDFLPSHLGNNEFITSRVNADGRSKSFYICAIGEIRGFFSRIEDKKILLYENEGEPSG